MERFNWLNELVQHPVEVIDEPDLSEPNGALVERLVELYQEHYWFFSTMMFEDETSGRRRLYMALNMFVQLGAQGYWSADDPEGVILEKWAIVYGLLSLPNEIPLGFPFERQLLLEEYHEARRSQARMELTMMTDSEFAALKQKLMADKPKEDDDGEL